MVLCDARACNVFICIATGPRAISSNCERPTTSIRPSCSCGGVCKEWRKRFVASLKPCIVSKWLRRIMTGDGPFYEFCQCYGPDPLPRVQANPSSHAWIGQSWYSGSFHDNMCKPSMRGLRWDHLHPWYVNWMNWLSWSTYIYTDMHTMIPLISRVTHGYYVCR